MVQVESKIETNGLKGMWFEEVETERFQRGVKLMCQVAASALTRAIWQVGTGDMAGWHSFGGGRGLTDWRRAAGAATAEVRAMDSIFSGSKQARANRMEGTRVSYKVNTSCHTTNHAGMHRRPLSQADISHTLPSIDRSKCPSMASNPKRSSLRQARKQNGFFFVERRQGEHTAAHLEFCLKEVVKMCRVRGTG